MSSCSCLWPESQSQTKATGFGTCLYLPSSHNSLSHFTTNQISLQLINFCVWSHQTPWRQSYSTLLSFTPHVSNIYYIRDLHRIQSFLDRDASKSISVTLVACRLDNYANGLLHGIPANNIKRLQSTQNERSCSIDASHDDKITTDT